MALNTLKYNHLTQLGFKELTGLFNGCNPHL